MNPFSNERDDSLIHEDSSSLQKTVKIERNIPLIIDGLELMSQIDSDLIATIFFDPQYRGILDKQKYGNEGKRREKRRVSLDQMDDSLIIDFIVEIHRILKPSGYLFLWVDKFHLCNGIHHWFQHTQLKMVDLIVWEKHNIGMGYRTRNKAEFLLVLQKKPIRSKGYWSIRNIPNVWKEKVDTTSHPHVKPLHLQEQLIEATTRSGEIVCDPAMGSGSVLIACRNVGRDFIGGDIIGMNR